MPVQYALYSAKQARYQKCVYKGLTVDGKPFCATEFTQELRKSYWNDGVFVGKVNKWYTEEIRHKVQGALTSSI